MRPPAGPPGRAAEEERPEAAPTDERRNMRRWAMLAASATFFVLALVGWASDVPPLACGLRAAAGAAVMFVLVRLALRVALNIVVDTMLRSRPPPEDGGGPEP